MTLPLNLEKNIASSGFDLVNNCSVDAKSIFNCLNKALGILHHNGVYAYFIWLESKGGSNQGKDIKKEQKVYRQIFISSLKVVDNILEKNPNHSNISDYIKAREHFKDKFINENTMNEFKKIIYVKRILEKVLIYAYYHSKALISGEEAKKEGEVDE